MNRSSIDDIINNKLWKRMTKNKHYRHHVIVPWKKGNHKHFQSLWMFFHYRISNKTLEKYLKDGRTIAWTPPLSEGLDSNDIMKVYAMKIIVFS